MFSCKEETKPGPGGRKFPLFQRLPLKEEKAARSWRLRTAFLIQAQTPTPTSVRSVRSSFFILKRCVIARTWV